MLGFLSVVIICHCIYSALRWRKFLQGNSQSIQSLPVDIIVEAIFGLLLGCAVIAGNARRLKKINQFEQTISYDKALQRKNFRNYDSDRGSILQDIVKKRLSVTQFVAP